MKVLFITSSYPANASDPRGIFIHRLARSIHQRGVEVTVLAPGAPQAPSHEVRDGVEVERVQYWISGRQRLTAGLSGIVPNLRRDPGLAFQIPPLLSRLTWRARQMAPDFDVIHAHWLYPGGIIGVLARDRRCVPIVVTSHGGDLNMARNSSFLRALCRWVGDRTDRCIGVSEELCRLFRGLNITSDPLFIPLGVELDGDRLRSQPDAESFDEFQSFPGLRVIYVGSLIPRKSVSTLLRAIQSLQQGGAEICCAIVGDGPSASTLRDEARSRSLTGIFFTGNQAPRVTRAWIASADVLALPSSSEGRPTVVLEAMAAAKPVVATDIPGTRELVEHGTNGFLFPPGDAARLASQLDTLMHEANRGRSMGLKGRERLRALGLTSGQIGARHVELYLDLRRRSGQSSGRKASIDVQPI